ncbi:MAG: cbb3-type cytochrome c oxidase N-terminal domain-containing protein [Flavobacteriaceae bacterium]
MSATPKQSWWKRFVKAATGAKSVENESDILLDDHDYDGIKELDNVLPPWWLYGFYITIGVSIFYYIQVFTNPDKYSQKNEYEISVNEAKEEVAAYKAAHPELYDDANLTAFTDATNIAKGKELFMTKTCTACHAVDGGGGIGPNLTDNYWILGGDFASIFNTLKVGGRPGKGMIAWESTLSQLERQQLTSYILTLQGTTPANPKEPQGELWTEE